MDSGRWTSIPTSLTGSGLELRPHGTPQGIGGKRPLDERIAFADVEFAADHVIAGARIAAHFNALDVCARAFIDHVGDAEQEGDARDGREVARRMVTRGRGTILFTGATGATIYRGTALGNDFNGNAFVADCGSNLIHRKQLRPNGVPFLAERPDVVVFQTGPLDEAVEVTGQVRVKLWVSSTAPDTDVTAAARSGPRVSWATVMCVSVSPLVV